MSRDRKRVYSVRCFGRAAEAGLPLSFRSRCICHLLNGRVWFLRGIEKKRVGFRYYIARERKHIFDDTGSSGHKV